MLAQHAKCRALKDGIPFALTAREVRRLQDVMDGGLCEMSGLPFDMAGRRTAASPSLDRIIPRVGYTDGNVRIILLAMNVAMGNWGEKETRRIMRAWLSEKA